MNFVQMKHMRSLKAYVLDLSAQMNATPKVNIFSRKFIFLGEVAKVDGGCLVQILVAS
jgi:hypothetical protein